MLRVRACFGSALLGLLVAPAVAAAHRPASKAQRATIMRAVVHQGELSSRQAACQTVTLSTVNRAYAALSWPEELSASCAKVAANGVIVERHSRSHWRLVAAGSKFDCPVRRVPMAVARDLGICGDAGH